MFIVAFIKYNECKTIKTTCIYNAAGCVFSATTAGILFLLSTLISFYENQKDHSICWIPWKINRMRIFMFEKKNLITPEVNFTRRFTFCHDHYCVLLHCRIDHNFIDPFRWYLFLSFHSHEFDQSNSSLNSASLSHMNMNDVMLILNMQCDLSATFLLKKKL